ncbi:MAG: hypothetical protein R2785_03410 [Flavobacteriaceae bacterium]
MVCYISILKEREIVFYRQKLESIQDLMNLYPEKKIYRYKYQLTFTRYNNLIKTVGDLKRLNIDLDFFSGEIRS